MHTLVLGYLAILLVHSTIQAALVLGFARALRRTPPTLVTDDEAPPAAIILSLRGTDPFLADCLRGLLSQDYPHYQVRIIVDHPDDSAHAVVAATLESIPASDSKPTVVVEFLDEKLTTCSLKCSSLLQVVRKLEDDIEFIAQIDADTIAHPLWLRQLATALQPDDVGAATGNRWYMPETPSVGALVRYTWNAAAIVQMYWYRIAWGGTLAIKTRVLRETDLLDKWQRVFGEDTVLHSVLKKAKLKTVFVPQLLMINREDCKLSGFFHWVKRQLMSARLHHPAWTGVLIHGVFTSLLPFAGLGLIAWGIVTGDSAMAWQSAAILLAYQASLALLLIPMESAARDIARARGEKADWMSLGGLLKCVAIMPLTQLVYAAALGPANSMRRTQWRGINYRIDGPYQITMEGYRPYDSGASSSAPTSSL